MIPKADEQIEGVTCPVCGENLRMTPAVMGAGGGFETQFGLHCRLHNKARIAFCISYSVREALITDETLWPCIVKIAARYLKDRVRIHLDDVAIIRAMAEQT